MAAKASIGESELKAWPSAGIGVAICGHYPSHGLEEGKASAFMAEAATAHQLAGGLGHPCRLNLPREGVISSCSWLRLKRASAAHISRKKLKRLPCGEDCLSLGLRRHS